MRPKLTYANVTSTIALVLALSGGVVWAAAKIHASDIAKHTIKAKNLADAAVSERVLKTGAVASDKLATGAVGPAAIADDAVGPAAIADGAVGSAALAGGAVGFGDLAAGSLFEINPAADGFPATVAGTSGLNLTGATRFTPQVGVVYELIAAARGNLGDITANDFCTVVIAFQLNGTFVEDLFLNSDGTTTIKPVMDGDEETVSVPVGVPQTLTATRDVSTTPCSAGSAIDAVQVTILRFPG